MSAATAPAATISSTARQNDAIHSCSGSWAEVEVGVELGTGVGALASHKVLALGQPVLRVSL